MIPVREQNRMRARFDRELKNRVRIDFFTRRSSEVAQPDRECVHCDDVQSMLEDLTALSTRISLTVHDLEQDADVAAALSVGKVPAIVLRGQANRAIRFFGTPAGSQFTVFLETLIMTSNGAVELQSETVKTLRKLRSDVSLRVLIAPSCTFSPIMAFNAFRFGLQSTRVKVDVVEIVEFPAVIQEIGLPAVPLSVINDTYATPGVVEEGELAQALLQAAEGKDVMIRSRPNTVTMLAKPQQGQPKQRRTASGLYLPR